MKRTHRILLATRIPSLRGNREDPGSVREDTWRSGNVSPTAAGGSSATWVCRIGPENGKGISMRQFLAASFALAVAVGAQAEGKCSAKGVMGGKKFSLSQCAIAYFDDEHSV